MTFIKVIEPAKADDLDHFVTMLERIERVKGNTISNAREVLQRPHFFAAMMIQYGQADGMVGGNQLAGQSIYRALIQLVKPMAEVPHIFGAAIMVSETMPHFGPDGTLYLADCGITDQPDIQELAAIAVQTGRLALHYSGRRVRVAMLSHSTMNSSANDSAGRVRAATERARAEVLKQRYDMEIDGEVEADVALDPHAAEQIYPVKMEGRKAADVLVFPNLDAAQISMKLLRHLGGATKYGHFVLGLTRPAAQVPLTVTPRMLLGTAAAVGAEAIKFHEMFPDG
jgi:phosphotransacetylase